MKTKLWDNTTETKLDQDIEKYTVGSDATIDLKLISYDIKASVAHSYMLLEMGILNAEENTDISSSTGGA